VVHRENTRSTTGLIGQAFCGSAARADLGVDAVDGVLMGPPRRVTIL
jgi:hypothetical protein